ncbi:MAG: cation:proton antiporter [Flavobacteriales bacterium]|nr:cation:proton antiporter [Flavobacteriales bacterium]
MFRARNWIFYVLTIACCLALMYVIVGQGIGLQDIKVELLNKPVDQGYWSNFKETYKENLTHPLAILLLQILTIIVTARVFGFLCQKIGLPSVVGEIAAGIFLGPSFLADHFPAYSEFLFPPGSLGNLHVLSQIGLILFMFVVGMELDLGVLRNRAQDAIVVSHASIIFPFSLGFGLAYFMYTGFAPGGVQFLSFALFLGIAMSITAFPVLARIVQERGLQRTRLGALAITCAAADDITAWCILAVVIAIVKAGSIVSSVYTVLMALAYVILMVRLVRPFLRKLGDVYADRESLSKPIVAVFVVILLCSAYTTEVIGIHALFGAFMAGVIMPVNQRFRSIFIEKVEDLAVVLLLPLFFVYTGLRTEIGLLNSFELWKWCFAILAVAVTGKFLGSALAARFVGQSWRESMILGALMNTRGLMELIVLNIGYDLGVLSPEIFAMLVIMALVTTFMTGPTLTLIDRLFPSATRPDALVAEEARRFRILVPFGDPERGRNMVRVAHAFLKRNENASVVALHLTPSSEVNQYNLAERERDSFRAIRKEQKEAKVPLEVIFKPSTDIDKELIGIANTGNFDLMIVGVGRSIYEGTLLGRLVGLTSRIIDPERLIGTLTGRERLFEQAEFEDRVRQIVKETRIPVGIYVDKGLERMQNVVIPLFGLGDSFLLTYAQKLQLNQGARITLLDLANVFQQNPELRNIVESMQRAEHGSMEVRNGPIDGGSPLKDQGFMLIGLDSWKRAVQSEATWLSQAPSMLIMRA